MAQDSCPQYRLLVNDYRRHVEEYEQATDELRAAYCKGTGGQMVEAAEAKLARAKARCAENRVTLTRHFDSHRRVEDGSARG